MYAASAIRMHLEFGLRAYECSDTALCRMGGLAINVRVFWTLDIGSLSVWGALYSDDR